MAPLTDYILNRIYFTCLNIKKSTADAAVMPRTGMGFTPSRPLLCIGQGEKYVIDKVLLKTYNID